ncbi:MAG: RpoL/Rpb11 RNA polymerase subunit family protein [Candidatus Nanoarchaeia archaeon]|jgi:DNA-directed RNA polymerase subunit L|nr:RpoL/Rpb11 RNA polymerase subunit family protein [Candidatus Nanoarchaeia archaeon]
MEILSKQKTLLKISFKPIDQGILNAVNDKIWEEKDVESSGFQVTHPEVGEAIFTVRTKSKDAKSVWNTAITNLTKEFADLAKQKL